jgi:hypothetical protein
LKGVSTSARCSGKLWSHAAANAEGKRKPLIGESDRHDPKSRASRYPEDKEGNPTLTRLDVVDLPTLKAGIHEISHYLDAIVEQIGEQHEWEAEMASW